MFTNGSSLSPAVTKQTCTNGMISDIPPNGSSSSLVQYLNNNSLLHNNNNGNKQQHIQMKRPYDEMSILRSLCSENHTIDRETEVICRKRSRMGPTDENGRQLQKSTKGSLF